MKVGVVFPVSIGASESGVEKRKPSATTQDPGGGRYSCIPIHEKQNNGTQDLMIVCMTLVSKGE